MRILLLIRESKVWKEKKLPNKTIYVRADDVGLWEEAEALSDGNVSALIADALRSYVNEERERKEGGMEAIQVPIGDRYNPRLVEFDGRWLVDPEPDYTRTAEPGYDAGAYYGVAFTKRGQVAIYVAHCNGGFDPSLNTYPSLQAAEEDGLPKDIVAEARRAVDPDYVEKLDI